VGWSEGKALLLLPDRKQSKKEVIEKSPIGHDMVRNKKGLRFEQGG